MKSQRRQKQGQTTFFFSPGNIVGFIDRKSWSVPIFTVLLAVCIGGCTTGPVRPELEPFQRTADYDYDLPNLADANNYLLTLTEEGFPWPAISSRADTALLEISLQGTRGQNPAIRIDAGGVNLVQYFEQGGQGRRYLDLSPLLQANLEPGYFIEFTGLGAEWNFQQVTLVTFTNPSLEGLSVLVVAPHPDDAEIAAFAVYQSSVAEVVTVTAGDAGGANFESLWPNQGEQYRAKGRIRTLDSLTVPFLGGLQPEAVRNLGYYDATLRRLWRERPNQVEPLLAELEEAGYYRQLNFDPELRDREFESSWQSLVADLLRELERVQPQAVVAPHPRLDRHLDHQFTAIALFEALNQWGRETDILLYTNHAIGNEAFPLGPRDGMTGLPAFNGEGLHLRRIFSHQLTEEDQRRKLVALEAMHDLRPFDLRDGSDSNPVPAIYDYFRRGARPNEIFFVTDLDGVRAIHREFLEDYQEIE
jgi:LmbE family N-acetylglucosaminyl deacetylase